MLTPGLHVIMYPHTYAHVLTYIKNSRKGHSKGWFENGLKINSGLENLVQMGFQEPQEKGVLVASEDLQGQMASQEKRVLPESVVAQVLQDPEE